MTTVWRIRNAGAHLVTIYRPKPLICVLMCPQLKIHSCYTHVITVRDILEKREEKKKTSKKTKTFSQLTKTSDHSSCNICSTTSCNKHKSEKSRLKTSW